MNLELGTLAVLIHENNKNKGFYDDEKNIGEIIALIHSEVSEALEADRKDKYATKEPMSFICDVNENRFKEEFEASIKDTFEDELADIMIRVLDLAAFKSIDIESHIKAKMRYNSMREFKHGKKY